MSSRAIRWAATSAALVVTLSVSVADASGVATPALKPSATTLDNAAGAGYSLSFSPNQPGKSLSLNLTLTSSTQPSTVAIALPAGVRLNTKAAPTCSAPPACEPSTQVATGGAKIQYGTYTIPLDFVVFNTNGGLAIVLNVPNAPPVVIPLTWSGTTLTIPYPSGYFKGNPIQITSVSMSFNQSGSGGGAYLRTPVTCPKAGWVSTATFGFSGGIVISEKAVAKCQTPKKKKQPPKKKKPTKKKKPPKKKMKTS